MKKTFLGPLVGFAVASTSAASRPIKQALLFFCLLLTLSFNVLPAVAQEWPRLAYEPTLDVVQLPDGWNLGEVPGVALNGEGHIFVFHRGQHPLLEFDSQGHFIRELGTGLFANPHGLRIDRAGNLWVTDRDAHLVLRFDKEGCVTMVLGKRGEASEGWFDRDYDVHFLDTPQDVGFDSEGNIYVADRGNARVIKFDPDGQFVTTWGTEGSEPGQFDYVHAIVVDSKDRIYVADRENRRIQIFDTNGVFLDEWTHIGYPYGLAITPDDTIWMTDARAERILKLNTDGQVLGQYGGEHGKAVGQFGFLHAIAVAPTGSLYVGEILNWRLQRLVPKN